MKLKGIFIFYLFLPIIVFSQKYPTGQGTLRSGGSMSFAQINDKYGDAYKLILTPLIEYFISDNVAIGAEISYTGILSKTSFTSSIRFTPTAKYYFMFSKKFFLTASMNYSFDKTTVYSTLFKEKDDNSSIQYGPGVAYFFQRRIGLSCSVLYTYYIFPDDEHTNKFGMSCGFNIHLQPKKRQNKLNEF